MPDNGVARLLYTMVPSTTVFLCCYSHASCSVCAVAQNSLNFRQKLLCFITIDTARRHLRRLALSGELQCMVKRLRLTKAYVSTEWPKTVNTQRLYSDPRIA